jgi:hypothetical protein
LLTLAVELKRATAARAQLDAARTVTGPPKAWRIWAVAPDEWVLRGIYIGQFWMTSEMTAECLDTPRHQPLDPGCTVGVYTFAHLEDALLEAVVLKTFGWRWDRKIDPAKIVLVLGVVELTGTITEWREERLYAFERLGEFPLELRAQTATIRKLVLFEDWLGPSGRDSDRLVNTLSRRYAPVHVVAPTDTLPDLNRLRELAVRLQKQRLDWLRIARAVAANVPAEDVRHLSRVIREQLGPES